MKKIFMIGDSIRFGASGNPGRPGSPAVTSAMDDSMHADWVHFGREASEILADAVIKACFG